MKYYRVTLTRTEDWINEEELDEIISEYCGERFDVEYAEMEEDMEKFDNE